MGTPGVEILLDMEECAAHMARLVRAARSSIYYSEFVSQLHAPLPGMPAVTLATLLTSAIERGVAVHMFVNPTEQYGNSMRELSSVKGLNVCLVKSDGYIPAPFNRVFGERYTNHHQKFLVVDDAFIMIGGVGVHPCRAGWLVLNTERVPYYWHEVGIVMPCSADMAAWVHARWHGDYARPLPVPFLSGESEHQITLAMIQSARTCIHMEAQLCISTPSTHNQVLSTVVDRVTRAYTTPEDNFRFMLLVNTYQPDEHPLVSMATTVTLHWSRRMMMARALANGVPESFMRERVFVGTLEHQGVHIKVHSNLVIQDGHTMLRSSSNLTDRSLSSTPCDNELGVVVRGEAVAEAQQALWARYFGREGSWYPPEAFQLMAEESGCVRAVRYHKDHDQRYLPDELVNFVMRRVHKLPYFGTTQIITWANDFQME